MRLQERGYLDSFLPFSSNGSKAGTYLPYADGEYVKQDLAYAKKMLSLAARQGDPDAEVMLQQLKKMKRR